MPYKEITGVFFDIHVCHMNALCGQNLEFLYVKTGSTKSNHSSLKG